MKTLNIAFCSSEIYPFAKTGGLADVCSALPKALQELGCKVKVFMPWYKGIEPKLKKDNYGISVVDNVEFIFIRQDYFFMRDNLYGTPYGDYEDNLERFVFFNKKILEILKQIKFKPDILHCNDWQTSLAIVYLKAFYKGDKFFKNTRSVLTIHNISYQGVFPKEKFPLTGLGWDYFTMEKLEFYDQINLLKGGIIFADIINTVSPTYAWQIKTSQYGWGLDGVLKKREAVLKGICNAIDYTVWNPAKDKYIYKKYSVKNIENKAINKEKLQIDFGLKKDKDILLLGMVSRLSEHKGIHLLIQILPEILNHCQVFILGVGGQAEHNILKNLQAQHKNSLVVQLKFDEKLAHCIYAASDCFLMPSQFEPCGLSQMISYKYGTSPIVHATGGLRDTVTDYSLDGGGFVFNQYSGLKLSYAIERARWLYCRKNVWQTLVKKIMHYDFSWHKTAKEYKNMYEQIL